MRNVHEYPILLENEDVIEWYNKNTKLRYYIIVDKEKKQSLSQFHWCVSKNGYAVSTVNEDDKRRIVYMHRMLCPGKIVDHIDNDKLRNTLQNLREVTSSQSNINKRKSTSCTSIYNGVSFHARTKKWQCQFQNKHQGWFTEEIWAAYRYNECIDERFPDDPIWQSRKNDVERPPNYTCKINQKLQNLPKGMYRNEKTNCFMVLISGCKRRYFTDKTRAETYLQECRAQQERIKEEKLLTISKLQITRNTLGQAVLHAYGWSETLSTEEKIKKEIIIDDNKWHQLKAFACHISTKNGGYAVIQGCLLHRFLLGLNPGKSSDEFVDHINGNKLDNRLCNLRLCHRTDSIHNYNKSVKTKKSSSRYKGVSWTPRDKCWRVQISKDKKRMVDQFFSTEEEAARFYDVKAAELYGSSAVLNFPENSPLKKRKITENAD